MKPQKRPINWNPLREKRVHALYPTLSWRFPEKEKEAFGQQKQLLQKGMIREKEGKFYLTPLGFFELLQQEETPRRVPGITAHSSKTRTLFAPGFLKEWEYELTPGQHEK